MRRCSDRHCLFEPCSASKNTSEHRKFRIPPRGKCSERKLQRQLNLPRIASGSEEPKLRGSQDGGSVAILRARFCEEEVGVIQDVEELGAEFQVGFLLEREGFE